MMKMNKTEDKNMNIMEAISSRHSVRSYQEKPISDEIIRELQEEIVVCNKESGLNIQLVTNEKNAFDGFMAHYGKFSGVQNYIALIGKKSAELDEKIGYFGERIAIKAQMLGLNTCWVAMTMSKGVVKKNCTVASGKKLVCALSLGYGTTQGVPHKSKPMDELCSVTDKPDWFIKGMESAMLAPTAMNQQKFIITLDGNKVNAKSKGGFYSMVDIGIVKYHFEVGAGKENFIWS